ncbi:kinase-like domain-containing protein [Rhizophagus irregularis DAOM 181602=DAOM 197198]|nr:kinase-like domain-containing protein [Rhizophagus irregularis DAOM 181602=DAOM 197198]
MTLRLKNCEIQFQREVDFHDNIIRFYDDQRKEYMLGSCIVICTPITLKLADFGLSRRIEETSNSQSKTFGVISYTDPRSFNRNTSTLYLLNKKSDVYIIGVLLWEIYGGQPPFHEIGWNKNIKPISSNEVKIYITNDT